VRCGAAQAIAFGADVPARFVVRDRLCGMSKTIGATPRGSYIRLRHDR
jgi:hypothetical protein